MKKFAYVCCIIGTVLFVNGCANQNAAVKKKEINPPIYMDADASSDQNGQEEPREEQKEQKAENSEFLAYIKSFADGQIGVDEAEWVQVPGSRADELNITEDDAPSGFSVYNPEVLVKNYPLAAACKIKVLDWKNSYAPLEISADQLAALLTERGEQNEGIPYEFVVKNGEVTGITEHYVP